MKIPEGLKKVVNLVIVDESAASAPATAETESDSSADASGTPQSARSAQAAQQSQEAQTGQPGVNSGIDVADLEKRIDTLIQDNPAYAPYRAFAEMSQSIAAAVPDEQQRYRAALLGVKTNLDALLGAVNSHADVLAKEQKNFASAFVARSEAEIVSLREQETRLNEEIGALARQLAEKNTQKDAVSKSINSKTAGLAKAKIDFESVRTTLVQKYDGIVKKLQGYLGESAHG
jgi:chromosome segregation ATPase